MIREIAYLFWKFFAARSRKRKRFLEEIAARCIALALLARLRAEKCIF